MARRDPSARALQELLTAFLQLPYRTRVALVAMALVVGLIALVVYWARTHPRGNPSSAPESTGPKTVVFCLWNMENLFDDQDDRRRYPDEEYDSWFVKDPRARARKYERLTEALLRFNSGHGPDIIVGNEIESRRAADLLKESLNSRLPAEAARYEYVAMEEIDAGRHIAPAVISRYPVKDSKRLGKRQRILEVVVTANGHDLRVVASHWTSQLSDKGGEEGRGRSGYAHVIYDEYRDAIRDNPKVDFLVCGDFNDSPDADSVANQLHVTGDASAATPTADPPRLFGLLAGKSPSEYGTHFYKKPLIYDQIAISPGLFDDSGWGYIPNSVTVPTTGLMRQGSSGRRPWRFGSRTDDALGRGYSDHFPVLATLKVAP